MIRTGSLAAKKVALLSSVALVIAMLPLSPASAKVGVAAAVNTDAKSKAPGAGVRVISIGESVVYNEQITTDSNGLVQILLLDGTTFTVGPDSQLTIDEFVYDPNRGEAKVVASVTKGAFRFIGGQASRKDGGAIVKTPVGTIGIRGAMVEADVKSGGAATFSMIFGKEVNFVGKGGARSKVFTPGFTLDVKPTGTDVRPRTAQDAAAFRTALAGNKPAGSKGGGARQAPTDAGVKNSAVTQVVSNLPSSVAIPANRPSPVKSSTIETVEDNVAQINVIAQQLVVDSLIEQGATNPPGTDDGRDTTPPAETPPAVIKGRNLRAPETYSPAGSGISFSDAGGRGLVGSTDETDQVRSFTKQGGRLISAPAGYDLPDFTGTQGDAGLQAFNVNDAFGPNGGLGGIAYAGAGDFAAYFLGEKTTTTPHGDPRKPDYTIFGTSTNLEALTATDTGNDIREYTLTPDPIRPSTVPFFANDLYGPVKNAVKTNFIAVEPGESETGLVRTFLTWIDIEGSGPAQKSATVVVAGTNNVDSAGKDTLTADRRGSFRIDAGSNAFLMLGDISTLAGPDGGHVFGPNANNFVLGADPTAPAAMYDVSSDSGLTTGNSNDGYAGVPVFSTHHVGDLVAETPLASQSRTSRTVSGFMNGLVETSANPESSYRVRSVSQPNMTMTLDAGENALAAHATVRDGLDESNSVYSITLGFGSSDTAPGNSTFVNDNVYGAVQDGNLASTYLVYDSENASEAGVLPGEKVDVTAVPGSYIVSGRAAPNADYQHCPDCDFIDWGWWGTLVSVPDNGGEGTRSEYVHLGTWVAGDITSAADLPTTIVATYSGTALGTVSRQTGDQLARYIASGAFDMTYDFNAREGDMTITNFDGLNFAGQVSESGDGGGFFSYISDGAYTYGTVIGAFVNNGSDKAAGAIGDFEFADEGVKAVGTLAAVRTLTMPSDPGGESPGGRHANGFSIAAANIGESQTVNAVAPRQASGFMAGLGESTVGRIATPYALTANRAPNLALTVDATRGAVGATSTVYDINDDSPVVNSLLLSFGDLSGSASDPDRRGDNTLAGNGRFSASATSGRQYTRLRTDGGQDLVRSAGSSSGSFMISGRNNPTPGLQHCTTCDFIDWGWWGTTVQTDPSGSEAPNGRNEVVRLGTWVAGDITNPADLPTNISATYTGTALGNIARDTANGVVKSIAAGDMTMKYDFASRSGTMAISNFDNINASGLISEQYTSTQALFGGNLSDHANGIQGMVDGAFVNSPTVKAAGVIGQFDLNGAGVQAVGTIAGSR